MHSERGPDGGPGGDGVSADEQCACVVLGWRGDRRRGIGGGVLSVVPAGLERERDDHCGAGGVLCGGVCVQSEVWAV